MTSSLPAFVQKWLRGIVAVVAMIGAMLALGGGCTAMVAVPILSFAVPYEYIEPRWLGGLIGGVGMLVTFGFVAGIILGSEE